MRSQVQDQSLQYSQSSDTSRSFLLGETDELVDHPFRAQMRVDLSVESPILEKLCDVQTIFFETILVVSLQILDQCPDDGLPTLLDEFVRDGIRLRHVLPEDVGEVLRDGLAVRVLGELHQPVLVLI